MKLEANEFALPLKDGRSCHASNIAVLPNGRVFTVYFCGSGEGKNDVRIFGSMREPGETGVWSEPFPITPDDGIPHWNPVLLPLPNGRVILFYKAGCRIAEWKTYVTESHDGCVTWSEPREMIPGDTSGGRGPVRNKPVFLKCGRIVCGGSTELEEWRVFFDISDDMGKSWRRTDDIFLPELHSESFAESGGSIRGRGIIQPTIWEDKNGVHALLRSSEGFIYRTDSSDNALSWCEPYKTSLPNNNSGIDLAQTDDGDLILAYNPISENWGERTPLSLAASRDSGDTWEHLTHLVTARMPSGFSYPAIRCEKNALYITYTWNRQTIAYMKLAL